MELHGRQIFGILEKPLSLATKFIFSLAEGRSLKSHGGSHDGHYKPSPSTHSPITSNPLIPAFLLLIVAFALLYSSPVRTWLTEADDLPTLAQIFGFSQKKKTPSLPKAGEDVSVWTKKQSGFYYCQGGTLFGNNPGKMMTQADALMAGYRPSGGEYCANSQPVVASAGSPSAGAHQTSRSADISPKVNESSALFAENQPGSPMAGGSVSVWAIKQFGFYYCRGDSLFGSSPGRLMTQSDALMAGLEPSYRTCTNNKPIQESAGNPPIEARQLPDPADTSPPALDPLALIPKKPPEASKAEEHVSVWVKTKLGFYYCHDDVLFGNKPGQLMTQADALTAGYQPSDGRCTKDKPTQASAERLPSRALPGTN
jgi:guanyl-specific ribonuclease Sa